MPPKTNKPKLTEQQIEFLNRAARAQVAVVIDGEWSLRSLNPENSTFSGLIINSTCEELE